MAIYDTNKIKGWYTDFASSRSNYASLYQSYRSSYIVTGSDSTLNKMQKKLDVPYTKIKNAYTKIGTQWKNLYKDIVATDNALAGKGSTGAINASSVGAKVSSMPKLKSYTDSITQAGLESGAASITAGVVNGAVAAIGNINTSGTDLQNDVSQANEKSNSGATITGGIVGSVLGGALLGPVGIAIGAAAGATVANSGVISKVKNWVVNAGKKIGEFFKKAAATVATFVVSLVEGLCKLVEDVVDLVALLGTVVLSAHTGIVDGATWLASKITGDESMQTHLTKNMWEGVRTFVSKDYVGSAFDKFYDNTSVGQFMKNNAWGFDTVRSVGCEVGEIVGIVAITVLTAGAGGAALGAAGAAGSITGGTIAIGGAQVATSTAMAVGYGAIKTAEHTETNWQDENTSTFGGFAKGALQGAVDGAFFYVGAEADVAAKAAAQGVTKTAAKQILGKKMLFEAGTAVAQDGVNIGLDAAFLKDEIKLADGTVKKFNGLGDKLSYSFDKAGGVKGLITSAATGAILSGISDKADIMGAARQGAADAAGVAVKGSTATGIGADALEKLFKAKNKVASGADTVGSAIKDKMSGLGEKVSTIKSKVSNLDAVQKAKTVKDNLGQKLHNEKLNLSYKFEQFKADKQLKLADKAIGVGESIAGLKSKLDDMKSVQKVKSVASDLKAKASDKVTVVKEKITGTTSGLKEKINSLESVSKLKEAKNNIGDKLHKNGLKISNKIEQFKADKQLKIAEKVISAGESIAGIKSKLDGMSSVQKVKSVANDLKVKVSDKIDPIKNKLKSVKESITGKTSGLKDKLSTLKSKVDDKLDGVKNKVDLDGKTQNLKSEIKGKLDDISEKISLKKENGLGGVAYISSKVDDFKNKLNELKVTKENIDRQKNVLKERLSETRKKLDDNLSSEKLKQSIDKVDDSSFVIKQNIVGGAAADDTVLKQVNDVWSESKVANKVKNSAVDEARVTNSNSLLQRFMDSNNQVQSKSEIYHKNMSYGIETTDISSSRNKLLKYKDSCDVVYWAGQNRIRPNDINFNIDSASEKAFMNFRIGKEMDSPLRNSYKIYLPTEGVNSISNMDTILDYLIKNNIASDNKIRKVTATDGICLRIYDINQAADVIDFINNNDNIKVSTAPSPFAKNIGKVAVAMDGRLSYNSCATTAYSNYLKITNNPTTDGFRNYLMKIKAEADSGNFGILNILNENGIRPNASAYANHYQVLETMISAVDQNYSPNDYFKVLAQHQNKESYNQLLQTIQFYTNLR